jgi:hypothetical protein
LLFGDPATALRIPLPRMPQNVRALRLSSGPVRIQWDAALDSNGNPVAGYHVYRASSPAGPYSKINTQLIATTEFVDTAGGVGAASGAGGGGTYYYAVSSEDGDGDQSAQSLGISPAAAASAAAGTAGCFIQSAQGSVSRLLFWLLVIFTSAVILTHWRRAQGARLKAQNAHGAWRKG